MRHRHKKLSRIGVSLLMLGILHICAPCSSAATVATFTNLNPLLVTNDLHLIDWAINTNGINFANTYMEGPGGSEVPFQIIAGGTRIAVQHRLRPQTTNIWSLKDGAAPTVYTGTNYVGLRTNTTASVEWGIEATNALTGFRTLKTNYSGTKHLAPLQGWMKADSNWVAGPIKLTNNITVGPVEVAWTNATTTFIELGPLVTIIRARVEFVRAAWIYGALNIPSAPAYFELDVILEAGRPSVGFTNLSSNAEVNFILPVGPFNAARWRGHSATSTNNGYLWPTKTTLYPAVHSRTESVDAFKDVGSATVDGAAVSSASDGSVFRMAYPWDHFTGVPELPWFVMLTSTNAAGSAPLVGYGSGKVGGSIGAQASGFGFQSVNSNGLIILKLLNRNSTGVYLATNKSVSAFLYTAAHSTLSYATSSYSPQYLKEATYWSGAWTAREVHSMVKEYGERVRYSGMFLPYQFETNLAHRVRTNEPGLASYLISKDPNGSTTTVNMWADATGVQTHAEATNIAFTTYQLLDAHHNRESFYADSGGWGYLNGGAKVQRLGVRATQVLSDPIVTAADKWLVKYCVGLLGCGLLDPDFFPLNEFDVNLLSIGSPNMDDQMRAFINTFGLFYTNHPTLLAYRPTAQANLSNAIPAVFRPAGVDSTHYLGTTVNPTWLNLDTDLQMGVDRFTNSLIQAHARYYMAMCIFDSRFARRKIWPTGDGAYEFPDGMGLMGPGFVTANPTLSAELQWLWKQCGTNYAFFMAAGVLTQREDLSEQVANITDLLMPDYVMISSHLFNTTNESSAQLLVGDWIDHRAQNHGTMLFAPKQYVVAGPWGPTYAPLLSGANMWNVCQRVTTYPEWNASNTTITVVLQDFDSSTNGVFVALQNGTLMEGILTNRTTNKGWNRKALHLENGDVSILVVKDSFTTIEPMVYSQSYFATGAISTPLGSVTPLAVTNANDTKYPAATAVGTLPGGLHKFGFTGQRYTNHPNAGLDFAVYSRSTGTNEVIVSQWAHLSSPTVDATDFQNANGYTFRESQHLLREKFTNGVAEHTTLAWRKGAQEPVVFTNGVTLVITNTGQVTLIDSNRWQFDQGTSRRLFGLFEGASGMGTNGMAITNGPAEVTMLGATNVTLTSHGGAGIREFTLPASGRPNLPMFTGGQPVMDYAGGEPRAASLEVRPP